MKATVYAQPRYRIYLSKEELHTILACSGIHYDSVCRDASKVGGFLYGWANWIDESAPDDMYYLCDTREMQTCLKILEMPPNGYALVAHRLTKSFRACINVANQHLPELSWSVPS